MRRRKVVSGTDLEIQFDEDELHLWAPWEGRSYIIASFTEPQVEQLIATLREWVALRAVSEKKP